MHPLARRETASLAEPRRSGEELSEAQGAYARLLGRIREASPAYANLVSGATVSFSEARSRLRQGELLLDYLVMDSTTMVFALTAQGLRSFEVPLPRSVLAGLVDFTRGVIVPAGAEGDRESWRAPLRRLHRLLIGAVDSAGLLAGKHRLIIVPNAELNYLPYAALLGSGPRETFLVERFEIVYAPSVSLWVHLGRRSALHPGAPSWPSLRGLRCFPAPAPRLPRSDSDSALARLH